MCRSREDITSKCSFAATTERANVQTKKTGIYYTAVRFAGDIWIMSDEYDSSAKDTNTTINI